MNIIKKKKFKGKNIDVVDFETNLTGLRMVLSFLLCISMGIEVPYFFLNMEPILFATSSIESEQSPPKLNKPSPQLFTFLYRK